MLDRAVGGPAIMAAQLDKILEAERRGRVTVQVVAFDFGAHAAQDSNFILFQFAENTNQSPVVSVEGLTGMQYLEKQADIPATAKPSSTCAIQLLARATQSLW